MARSAHTEPTTVPPAPSRQETLPAASSWRSAQTPLPPASTASSPNPTRHPPRQHYTTITAAGFCRGSLTAPQPSSGITSLWQTNTRSRRLQHRFARDSDTDQKWSNPAHDSRDMRWGPRRTGSRRGLLRGDAAVDYETGPGHEAGIVRGEKDNALGDVGHLPHAADRQPG